MSSRRLLIAAMAFAVARIRFIAVLSLLAAALVGTSAPPAAADHGTSPVKLNKALPDNYEVGSNHLVGDGDFVLYFLDRPRWQGLGPYVVPVGGGASFAATPPGHEWSGWAHQPDSDVVIVKVDGRDGEVWATNIRTETRMYLADAPNNSIITEDITLAPGGEWVSIRRAGQDGYTDLYPTAGGAGVRMGPAVPPGHPLGLSGTAWTGDGSHFVYTVIGDGGARIFSYEVATGNRYPLSPWTTDGLAKITTSPNGTRVAYRRGEALYTVNEDGTERTKVFPGVTGTSLDRIEFTPTGEHVVFLTDDGNRQRYRAAPSATTGQTTVLISDDVGNLLRHTISHDGLHIVVETEEGQAARVYAISIDGDTPVAIEDGTHTGNALFFDISPDSTHVMYAHSTGGGKTTSPLVMPITGGESSPLVPAWPADSKVTEGYFSPVGGHVVFRANIDPGKRLYRVPITGGEAHEVSDKSIDKGVDEYFMFSPNGQYIVYQSGDSLSETNKLYSVDIGYRCAGELATIVGTPAADVLDGTSKRDVIVALGGGDQIRGKKGNDIICADGGSDTVIGGSGKDFIYGGTGADTLIGGGGADRIWGNAGNDDLSGEGGNDRLKGGTGDDILRGKAGDDDLTGGPDTDDCRGGSGTDTATTCESTTEVP